MESPDVYIEKAKEEASNYGKIIGMVTRVEEVSHGEDKRVIRAEIPYDTYLNEDIKVGQYLGVISAVKRNVFLTRVIEVMRADIVSSTHLPAVRVIEEPASITTPLSVKLELLAEIGKSGVIPPVSPVDPQSPLILPSNDFLIKTLGLPKPEVKVGRILDGGEPSEVEIGFDWDLLNHHLLVIGTTGSGKTNFLRVLHTRSPWGSIVFDIQGDYFVPTALEGGRIVVPLTKDYANKPVVDLIKMITKRSGLVDAQIDEINGQEFQITAKYKEKEVHFTLELATVNLKRSYKEISDSSPIMTEQAAAFFNMGVEQENLSSLNAWEERGEGFLQSKKVASSTINNLMCL
ncbi:MAG: DUF87 domain-containing protein [Sulfolobus sp.]|nr:DUF87 domain-containing protein [Sulfolobus sp.]